MTLKTKTTQERSVDRIARNPRRGDKLRNRRADPQTRLVTDRTLGGDVHYCWNARLGYFGRCSLADWKSFCDGAVVLSCAKDKP